MTNRAATNGAHPMDEKATETLSGECLCGAVRWQIKDELSPFAHCHCSVCRKLHGTAFATYTGSAPNNFAWLSGEDNVGGYESSPGLVRQHCRTCGAVVPMASADKSRIVVPTGNVMNDVSVGATAHLFVASKAPWYSITDTLRQFPEFPRSSGPSTLHARTRNVQSATLSGSCACADVVFEVHAPLETVRNCHCTRCRRGRSAVHATNGFVPKEAVKFVRGEDRLRRYKVPDARVFTQTFCVRCASLMPTVSVDRALATIPFGSLDNTPDQLPDSHIYVANKAPWHTISDDLRQFDAGFIPG